MRPGLRESIEPSGADGGNVGADAGGRTRSSALNWPNSLEFVCLETLCAPKRTDSMYSGHVSGWDRPPVDPLDAHSPWWRVRGHAITTGGTTGQKSEFRIRFRRGARLAGGNRALHGFPTPHQLGQIGRGGLPAKNFRLFGRFWPLRAEGRRSLALRQ